MKKFLRSPQPVAATPPPGFPSAHLYTLTQDVIIPKAAFFEKLVAEIEAHAGDLASDACLTVAEPGCGPGFFFPYLIEHFTRDERQVSSAYLCGIDRQPEMLKLAMASAEKEARRQGARHRWVVSMRQEADALSPRAEWWKNDGDALGDSPWSVILASQFEQYAPNSLDSPLGRRLATRGLQITTKDDFRRQAYATLSHGGLYAVITDIAGDTPEQTALWDRAWDTHVARTFASLDFLRELADIDMEAADFVARHYNPRVRSTNALIALAARARRRRRFGGGEEVVTATELRSGLESVFGSGNVSIIPHPQAETHPQFVLALAWKR